jgi:hypothetical protein
LALHWAAALVGTGHKECRRSCGGASDND